MQSANEPSVNNEGTDSYLKGVYGWLLFFVIIFFINALNIFSLPFTVRVINWNVLWHENETLTVYFALSSIVEFTAAIVSGVIGVLILMRRRAAVDAVNIYCLLIGGVSLVGLFMVDSMVELFNTDIPVINFAHYCKFIPGLARMDLDEILNASLYFSYSVVIIVTLLIFLYFRLSRRVKVTLVN